MSRGRKKVIPLSDEDRVDLIPTMQLIDALRRRFEGGTLAMLARKAEGDKSETYCLDDGGTLSLVMRKCWMVFDEHVPKSGDEVHLNEDGEWHSVVLDISAKRNPPSE
ncbi:MAG TPA: hypothetical protein VIG24_03490 [Acidimicrobiia bacterium]